MIYISTIACLAVSCKMRRTQRDDFFLRNVKLVKTVLEYQDILERGEKEYEKKAAVFFDDINVKVFSSAGVWAIKEKDDNQADAKTEQSQNADNSKDNDKVILKTKRQTIRCTSYLRRTMYGL